ncbi:e33a5dc3-1058-4528-a290-681455243632 [Thermothielavioides terrestris]|uniref:E33a5dc3-1058-4528-a290-681455243632 n=1 Tax=Thermothielavioides terrestris TaxID=2587410 RepID=A0A446BLD1_9PEZI|nr:e33a5dc3-1058-4528-a290-681455243632 [Thermothielavioides terrestris]
MCHEIFGTIQEEFRSVLDESLIVLIANERDVVQDYTEIRDVLNQLAEPAREEADSGFDPSGLGSLAELQGLQLDETTASRTGLESSGDRATTISEFSDQFENQRLTEKSNLSDEEKIQELKLVFNNVFQDHTLRFILKRCAGDLGRALDELLNRQHLQESGALPKGVDGFFSPEDEDRQPSNTRAARAHKGKGTGQRKGKKQTVVVNYKAISPTVDDGELEGAKDFVRPTGSRGSSSTPSLPPPVRAPLPASSPAVLPATDLGAANLRAAAALRRMGPLGRQGAAVYTERAREEARAFSAQASLMAEAHVAQQSTDSMLDLHGVFVMDGVRIAKQRVWAWWEGLGENRKALAKQNGFTVVTGVGKHSAGGVSRLRQAIGAFLKNDGWKVETLTGSFYVTGRV